MKRRLPDFLSRPRPTTQEAIFAIFVIGFVVNGAFAYADIVVHDNFILPIISGCYPDSTNEICQKIRSEQNCHPDNQMCLGQKYWTLLPQLVLLVSGTTAILVMFFRILGGAKINGMLFLIGFAWFFTGIILPYTGWGDYVYFVIKGEPIPETLPWLNNAGFLKYINVGQDPYNVEKIDLYFVMSIGILLLVGLWYGLTHLNRKYLKFVN